jgi:hypothetical protein
MVQTITPVVHGGRRSKWGTTISLHAFGAGVSGGAFGVALGAVGSFLGAPWGRAGMLFIAGIAFLYAAREAFGLPFPIPDRRRQVPQWWRSTFSVNSAAMLYGLGLGVGFLTYVRYGTLVAVSAVAIASGDPLAGAAVMMVFGLVRGLSVGVAWTADSIERVQSVVDRLESLAEGRAPKAVNTLLLFLIGLTALFNPVAGEGEPAIFVAPWALALVFGWAAMSKWARFPAWRATLRGYGLSRPLEGLALGAVPVAESAVSVLALSGQTRQSAALAAMLLIVFSAAVVRARVSHGRKLACGCFGRRSTTDYRMLLFRNAVLGAAAAAVLSGKSGPLLERLRGPHLREAVPAALVLVALALTTVVVVQISRLRGWLKAAPVPRS